MEIIVFSLDFLPQETGYKLLHGRMGEDAIRGNLSRYRTEHLSYRERGRQRGKENKSLFWLAVYILWSLLKVSTCVWKFIKKLSEIYFN